MRTTETGWLLTFLAALAVAGCSDRVAETTAAADTPDRPGATAVSTTVDDDVPVVGDDAVPPRARPADGKDLNATGQAVTRGGLAVVRIADSRFAEMLAVLVDDAGLVRYDLLDHPRWASSVDTVVSAYAKSEVPDDRDAKLAFWANAYNANVLAMVVRHGGAASLESVRDVSGFFDTETITVGGETLTLNALENDRIRPLGDPRIHAALVCAAKSCPPLRAEPFRAEDLDEQLDDQSRRWVRDDSKNRVDDGTPKLSRIFDWYGDDFVAEPYGGVIGFAKAFAAPDDPLSTVPDDAEIEFLPYDWSLNQAPVRERPEK